MYIPAVFKKHWYDANTDINEKYLWCSCEFVPSRNICMLALMWYFEGRFVNASVKFPSPWVDDWLHKDNNQVNIYWFIQEAGAEV